MKKYLEKTCKIAPRQDKSLTLIYILLSNPVIRAYPDQGVLIAFHLIY